MGLHWGLGLPVRGLVDDLDAACILFDAEGHALEVVHPGHLRNANGSVVHTGDSQTGAAWDNERIFVFLEALAADVSALAFVVINTTSRVTEQIAGAFCHISDRRSGRERVRIDLSTLHGHSAICVAMLCRSMLGWQIASAPEVGEQVLKEICNLTRVTKRGVPDGDFV